MNTHEPLPPHLERLGNQLVAAAHARAVPARWRRQPKRVALIVVIGALMTSGAAAAAVTALINTNDHQLFSPNSQGTEQPIDSCQQTADGSFQFCTSAVGSTVQVKDANGEYVDPSDCVRAAQTETCNKPYRFTLDLSNPSHPTVRNAG